MFERDKHLPFVGEKLFQYLGFQFKESILAIS